VWVCFFFFESGQIKAKKKTSKSKSEFWRKVSKQGSTPDSGQDQPSHTNLRDCRGSTAQRHTRTRRLSDGTMDTWSGVTAAGPFGAVVDSIRFSLSPHKIVLAMLVEQCADTSRTPLAALETFLLLQLQVCTGGGGVVVCWRVVFAKI
jgi:hypothetical protein